VIENQIFVLLSEWYQLNGISNDNDVGCIRNLNSLVDPVSNNKQFCFHKSNVDYMMNGFHSYIAI